MSESGGNQLLTGRAKPGRPVTGYGVRQEGTAELVLRNVVIEPAPR